MADFTVRIELHGASGEDYEKLHERMKVHGYAREVQGDDGKWYHLPTAEYVTTKALSSAQVRDEVRTVASSVRQSNWVLVTESNGRSWYLTVK